MHDPYPPRSRSDVDDPARPGFDPTAPDNPDDRSSFEAWQAERDAGKVARAEEANNEPACPVCNATDANPSHEILPHCWKCGHANDGTDGKPEWPPADTDARREATARRRVGLG